MISGLRIIPCRDGGFAIFTSIDPMQAGIALFAGDLNQCLAQAEVYLAQGTDETNSLPKNESVHRFIQKFCVRDEDAIADFASVYIAYQHNTKISAQIEAAAFKKELMRFGFCLVRGATGVKGLVLNSSIEELAQ